MTDLLASYWTTAGDAEPGEREWSRIDIEKRVRTVADTGFSGTGIWHADLEHILDDRTFEDLRGILDQHGMKHLELEFIEDWFLDPDDPRRERSDERRKLLLDAAEALDANHVKVGDFSGLTPDIDEVTASFGALCDEAAAHGTEIGLEFVARAGTLNDFENALQIVREADRENGGLLIDAWHITHLDVSAQALRSLKPEDITFVELNDGPLNGLRHRATVHQRCLPGQGEFDLPTIVSAIQSTGYEGPWGVEILSSNLRQEPYDDVCQRAYDATMALFD